MDLTDIFIAKALAGGSGGGGGGGDFTTAALTVSANSQRYDLTLPVVYDSDQFHTILLEAGSYSGITINVPLYKGALVITFPEGQSAWRVVSGEASIEDGQLLITGDCTIAC